MIKETFRVTLKRSREQSFLALTDVEPLFEKTTAGELRLERLPGRPRTGLGSAFLIKGDKLGGREALVEVVEWRPSERVVRKVSADGVSVSVEMDFSEAAGGTSLEVAIEIVPENTMFRLMLPLFRQKITDEAPKAVARLQAALDAQIS